MKRENPVLFQAYILNWDNMPAKIYEILDCDETIKSILKIDMENSNQDWETDVVQIGDYSYEILYNGRAHRQKHCISFLGMHHIAYGTVIIRPARVILEDHYLDFEDWEEKALNYHLKRTFCEEDNDYRVFMVDREDAKYAI